MEAALQSTVAALRSAQLALVATDFGDANDSVGGPDVNDFADDRGEIGFSLWQHRRGAGHRCRSCPHVVIDFVYHYGYGVQPPTQR